MTAREQDRFWRKVRRTDTCWLWVGATTKSGYGVFVREDGVHTTAHRVSLEHRDGPLAAHEDAAHRCDVKPCVRPDHLFRATRQENMDDMIRKGRSRRGDHHQTAKIGVADVRAIRRRHAAGVASKVLAVEYGITPRSIRKVARGVRWGWVGGAA